MACGVPVVATEVGGVPEVVLNGQTGLLSPADDPEAYAANLRGLLFDPERARDMGRAARTDVAERFGRDQVVSQYESLYRRVRDRRQEAHERRSTGT
jgi:glycosyltransferase involved in cell wall biosynthesis